MNISVKIMSVLSGYDILFEISKLYVPQLFKIVSSTLLFL